MTGPPPGSGAAGVAADALEPEFQIAEDDDIANAGPAQAMPPDTGAKLEPAAAPAVTSGEERRQRPAAQAVPDVAGTRPPPIGAPALAAPAPGGTGPAAHAAPPRDLDPSRPTCTAPQLRRFIKSRAYVPMHELRRRFSINGDDDEVCQIDLEVGRIYVGLPASEGRMLGELVRGGEVGYELSMDPRTPIVIGVYSMRPVSRT